MTTTVVQLDRNNAGDPFIGATDYDANGYGIRAYVLAFGRGECDKIMEKHFEDFKRLMARNVESFIVTDAFTQGKKE